MQLGFTHRTLEAEQQAIVEQRRMIDAVVIANQRVGDTAQLQQAIPIGIVARQSGDFQTEDDAHVSQGNLTGQANKPGPFIGGGTGEPEVFIDDDHLLPGPAQFASLVGQGVLTSGGFAVMLHLRWLGLAKIYVGCALGMRRFDFGGISHGSAP
jgi:hypothetical protein